MWEKGKRKEISPQEGDKEVRKNLRLDDMETSFDFCQRMTKMMYAHKEKVGTTLALMVTEVMEEMDSMQEEIKSKDKEIRKLREQLEEHSNVVSFLVVTKDKLEVKASSKNMEERLKVARTQFKVMDMDIGKETNNRIEILTRGMAA